MSGQVVWDSDEVSRASSILEASGENVAAYVLDTPSGVGSNEGRLSERIARINEVIGLIPNEGGWRGRRVGLGVGVEVFT